MQRLIEADESAVYGDPPGAALVRRTAKLRFELRAWLRGAVAARGENEGGDYDSQRPAAAQNGKA